MVHEKSPACWLHAGLFEGTQRAASWTLLPESCQLIRYLVD
jgi:hypothetical protein